MPLEKTTNFWYLEKYCFLLDKKRYLPAGCRDLAEHPEVTTSKKTAPTSRVCGVFISTSILTRLKKDMHAD